MNELFLPRCPETRKLAPDSLTFLALFLDEFGEPVSVDSRV